MIGKPVTAGVNAVAVSRYGFGVSAPSRAASAEPVRRGDVDKMTDLPLIALCAALLLAAHPATQPATTHW
jgi:hypothetical protein